MTPRQAVAGIPDWMRWAGTILFLAGVAWGTSAFTLGQKADRTEVESLSTKMDRLQSTIDDVQIRQREMYCAQLPEPRRPGCR